MTQYKYDSFGQLDCTAVRMDSGQWSGQTDACVPQLNGPNGPDRITKNSYDLAGQLTKVTEALGVAGVEADEATYAYTVSGKRQYLTDARGYKAEMGYDGHDRQVKWSFPDKVTPGVVSATDFEAYTLDLGGNRTALRKRDAQVIGYSYDLLNRMTVKDVPVAGGDVAYAYNNLGAQTAATFSTSGQGITSAYDPLGRLTSSTNNLGGTSRMLTHQYDLAGNRTRITHPDAVRFDMSYDAMSRMANATWTVGATTTPFMAIAYEANTGLRSNINRASSWTAYGYDAVGRLAWSPQTFANSAHNLTQTFSYNPASQTSAESRDNDTFAYPVAAGSKSYSVNGLNQYTAISGALPTHDANGNLTSDGLGQSYSYDAENRLVSASGTKTATLTYDPLGRLFEVSGGGTTTRFLYDGDELVAEYNAAGTLLRRYMHGPGTDEPIVADEGGALNCSGTKVLHTDRQGSIVATADCNGNRTAINAFDEYGTPAPANAPISAGGRFGYTGQIWIPELGLWYYKARFYSPKEGRFLQIDPVGYEGGINLYRYATNDPLNLNDSDGRKPGDPYSTPQDAMVDWQNDYNPKSIRENREYHTVVYKKGDSYYGAKGVPTTEKGGTARIKVPPGVKEKDVVEEGHTHGDYSSENKRGDVVRADKTTDTFESDVHSQDDRDRADDTGRRSTIGTPSGAYKVYDPKTGDVATIEPRVPEPVPPRPDPPSCTGTRICPN